MRYLDLRIVEGYKEVAQKFSQTTDPNEVKKFIDAYKDLVNRNQVQGNERNIDWWGKQGWANFVKFVRAKNQQQSQTQQKQRKQAGNSHTLAETPDWLIVVPLDKEASCFHGKDTDWCTTKPQHDYFEKYFRDDSVTLIYFLQKKTGNKWAMAVYNDATVEYFDKNDASLKQEQFDEQTGISSEQYRKLVTTSGSPVQKQTDDARSAMQDEKRELEDRIDQFLATKGEPARRDAEIETLLYRVKSTPLLKSYVFELADASDTGLVDFDQNMQSLIVSKAPYLLKYVSNTSDRSARAAVKTNAEIIQYIRNPSDVVMQLAVETDPFVIQHIKNPSEDVIKLAIQASPYAVFNIKSGLTTENLIQATDAYLNMSNDDGGPDTRNGVPVITDVLEWLRNLTYKSITVTDYKFYRWLVDNYKNGDNAVAGYFMINGKIYNEQIAKEITERKPSYAEVFKGLSTQ